jgi:hypothetical protein
MTEAPRILYCHCAYAQVVPKDVKQEVLARLTAAGVAFEAVPDLCELSARGDNRLQQLAQGGDLRIAACYPRAVKWLFDAAGAPLPAAGVEIRNMRVETAADVVEGLLRAPSATLGAESSEKASS